MVTLSDRLGNSCLSAHDFFFTEGCGVPTSVDFIRTETSQMVASYSSAQCIIYDLETAAPVVSLDSAKTYSKYAGRQRLFEGTNFSISQFLRRSKSSGQMLNLFYKWFVLRPMILCSETSDRLVTIFGSISVSGQLPTYPSLNPTLTLSCC